MTEQDTIARDWNEDWTLLHDAFRHDLAQRTQAGLNPCRAVTPLISPEPGTTSPRRRGTLAAGRTGDAGPPSAFVPCGPRT
jgi:hypothetical protein